MATSVQSTEPQRSAGFAEQHLPYDPPCATRSWIERRDLRHGVAEMMRLGERGVAGGIGRAPDQVIGVVPREIKGRFAEKVVEHRTIGEHHGVGIASGHPAAEVVLSLPSLRR